MSYQYDKYLANHKKNVKKGYDWLLENLPDLVKNIPNLEWQCCFAHDQSKSEKDEYEAYDAYFYGNNKSYMRLCRNIEKLGYYTFTETRITGNIGF